MANEEAKKPSKKRNVTKKQVVLYSYIGVLAVVTVLFGYNVLKYFLLRSSKGCGAADLRLSYGELATYY